jgi:tetratricopeptide (TPR) repeat protein
MRRIFTAQRLAVVFSATTAAAITHHHYHHNRHNTTTTTPRPTMPFTAFAASKAKSKVNPVLTQADALFDQGQDAAAPMYALLKSAADAQRQVQPTDSDFLAELLWRQARAARLLSIDARTTSKEARKQYAFETLALAQEAAKLAPNNWAAHKWIAVGYKVVGDHVDTKAKLQNSFLIRDEFARALELNPTDATTTCLLGQWHYYFADMPWYERQAASLLFAAPPSSTYDAALALFLKAEQLEPGFYKKNAQMLASTYYRLGKYDDAKKWKQTALAMPTKTLDDEEAHQQASKLNV